MDVDAALAGDVQHRLGQDPSVGHHRADIRVQPAQLLHRFRIFKMLRLEHRNPMLQSQLLHRRGHHLHAPALGTVRLGVNAHHLEAILQNLFQAGRRNIRRTHKYNSHCHTSGEIYASSSNSSSVRTRSMTWV